MAKEKNLIKTPRAPGSITDSAKFRAWFGASAVVDSAGLPRIVYHGTSAEFTTFDPDRQAQTAGVGGGFFFTSSQQVASEVYGYRLGGRVMSVYLSLQNPLGFDEYFALTNKDRDEETEGGRDAPVNYFDNNAQEVLSFAKSSGYDGLVWPADPDSKLAHDLIIAFENTQIVSATASDSDIELTEAQRLQSADDTQVASKLAKPQTIPSGLISLGYELLARGDSRRFKTFGTWQKNGVRIALSGNTLSAERGSVMVYQADDGEMTLEALITDPELRGQGRASAALRELTSIADEVGAKLFLEPVQLEASGLDRNSLEKLYTSAGFESADDQSTVMMREAKALNANSDDIRFSETPQTSENLAAWFGKSVVATDSGEPRMVFHATKADFTVFDPLRSSPSNRFGPGLYFTSDPATLDVYAEAKLPADGGLLVPVYLQLERAQTDGTLSAQQVEDFFAALQVSRFPNGYDATADHARLKARALNDLSFAFNTLLSGQSCFIDQADWLRGMDAIGIDGIVREVFGQPEYVVFKSTQVKSAIGNNGNFDPANSDIRYSLPDTEIAKVATGNNGEYSLSEDDIRLSPERDDGAGVKLIKDLSSSTEAAANGLSFDVTVNRRGVVTLERIDVEEEQRWNGVASRFLNKLTSLADLHGVVLDLEVGSGTDSENIVDDLPRFYTKWDFAWDDNDNVMVRQPTAADISQSTARDTPAKSANNNGDFDGGKKDISQSPVRDQAYTPEFKQWFGDSKVVDANGKPLVVYHGTDATDIQYFYGRESSGWFSESPAFASKYAVERRSGDRESAPNVLPVYLSIRNPLVLDFDMNDDPARALKVAVKLGLSSNNFTWAEMAHAVINNSDFMEAAAAAGYDGVSITERGEPTWAPLVPEQIKSSIGNNGQFDGTNPDIRYSLPDTEIAKVATGNNGEYSLSKDDIRLSPERGQTDTPEFKQWFSKSQVVDAQGKPLVVYHGTDSNISEFSEAKSSNGFWFTTDPSDASDYGNTEIAAYLALVNPARYARTSGDVGVNEAIAKAKASGHDGLIVSSPRNADTNGMYWPTNYVAFNPTQIKSSIGNNGQFDGTNPDIRYSLPAVREASAAERLSREVIALQGVTATFEDYTDSANNNGDFDGGKKDISQSPVRDQTDTPEFKQWFSKSQVVDAQGKPLMVYRGEHGPASDRLQSHLGSISFGDHATASSYAMEPNTDGDLVEAAKVIPAYLRIVNPFINNPYDPFLEMSVVIDKLGMAEAKRIAEKYKDDIEYTGNWMQNEDGIYEGLTSVTQLVAEKPELIKTLYFNAYRFFDDADEVEKLQELGFDGAIHVGNGVSRSENEYKIFDQSQAKSAIGNNGQFDSTNADIRYSLPAVREASAAERLSREVIALQGVTATFEDYTDSEVELVSLQASSPGAGMGTKAMQAIELAADKFSIRLMLVLAGDEAKRERLRAFYGRFGFQGEGDVMRRAPAPAQVEHERLSEVSLASLAPKAPKALSKRAKSFTIESPSNRTAVAMVGKLVVGQAHAWTDSRGEFVIMKSEVRPQYRRRGIALAMYQKVEETSGRQLKPAVSLSDDAFAFWKSFRPEAVANDLRHRPELIGRKAQKDGRLGTIIRASGGGATIEYDDGNTAIGTQSYIGRDKLDAHLLAQTPMASLSDDEQPTQLEGQAQEHDQADDQPEVLSLRSPALATTRNITAFHGTSAQFDVFAPSSRGSFGSGIYFADEKAAACYAQSSLTSDSAGPRIIEARLHFENPLEALADYAQGDLLDLETPAVPLIKKLFGVKADAMITRAREGSEEGFGPEVQAAAMAQGYDGLILTYPDDSKEYVAFSARQVTRVGLNAPLFEENAATTAIMSSFAGSTATTAVASQRHAAQSRVSLGEDASEVRRDTLWFVGMDGQWRFELSDDAATIMPALGNLRTGGFQARLIESATYAKNADGSMRVTLNPPNPRTLKDFVQLNHLSEEMLKALLPEPLSTKIFAGAGRPDFLGNFEDALCVDHAFTFGGFNALPLDAVLSHSALFQAYPMLRNISVQVDPKMGLGASLGVASTGQQVLTLGLGQPKQALLHEIQHAIQNIEGFAEEGVLELPRDRSKATSVELAAADHYFRLAGEVEAKNAEARPALTPAQRAMTDPESTADVARERGNTERSAVPATSGTTSAKQLTATPESVRAAVARLFGPDFIGATTGAAEILVVNARDLPGDASEQKSPLCSYSLMHSLATQNRHLSVNTLITLVNTVSFHRAQAFYDKRSRSITMIADRIPAGREASVLMHELTHKYGRDVLEPSAWQSLVGQVKAWRHEKPDSNERLIYNAALRRTASVKGLAEQTDVYEEELFAYAVESAVAMGIEPSASALPHSAEAWLAEVVSSIERIGQKLSGRTQSQLSSQDLVDLAYALAQLETPEQAGEIKKALVKAGLYSPNEAPIDSPEPVLLSEPGQSLSWYSALARAIEKTPMMGGNAEAWQHLIRNLHTKGVKPEELHWSGLADWLAHQEGRLSKQSVLEYLALSSVQVQEVIIGGDSHLFVGAVDRLNSDGFKLDEDDYGGVVITKDGERVESEKMTASQRRDLKLLQTAARRADDPMTHGSTEYSTYQLPGATGYREMLLVLPPRAKVDYGLLKRLRVVPVADGFAVSRDGLLDDGQQTFSAAQEASKAIKDLTEKPVPVYSSHHWAGANVLAHVRFNERESANGQRVMFVEELQSDWGQQGKKRGFVGPETTIEGKTAGQWQEKAQDIFGTWANESDGLHKEWSQAIENAKALREKYKVLGLTDAVEIPGGPFVTVTQNWLNLSLKRIIGYAVEHGFDQVAFASGSQLAKRFGQERHLASAAWTRVSQSSYDLNYREVDAVDRKSLSCLTPQELEHHLGEHLSSQVLASAEDYGFMIDLNVKVGGDGMKHFYDVIVPNTLGRLVRKLGGNELQQIDFDIEGKNSIQMGFDVTPAMREAAMQGMPLFSYPEKLVEECFQARSVPSE